MKDEKVLLKTIYFFFRAFIKMTLDKDIGMRFASSHTIIAYIRLAHLNKSTRRQETASLFLLEDHFPLKL